MQLDIWGSYHDIIDVCMHAIQHVTVFGIILFKFKNKNLILLFLLRLLLEVGFHQEENRIYGRRRKHDPLPMTVDIIGTLFYTVLEIFITYIAANLPMWLSSNNTKKPKTNSETTSESEVEVEYSVLSDILTNKNGTALVVLYHWCYIMAADVYIQTKIPWVFHASHIINFLTVPVVIPMCRYITTGKRNKISDKKE